MALKLSLTCGPYDRLRALIDGTVKPEGIDLSITVNGDDVARQREIFSGKFDVFEFYTGRYIADLGDRLLGCTAIPIFVKRMFRHSYIYVNKRSKIRSPKDLEGKRVGTLLWCTSASIWARGLLAEEFEVDLKAVNWVVVFSDTNSGRAGADIPNWNFPAWANVALVPPDRRDLFRLLADGEIDAAFTTEPFAPGMHPDIDFLFPNYAELERDYYRKTGFFPIHHTLMISDAVLKDNPWVAMSLFNAFQESKQQCYEWLKWQRKHQTSLWYRALWEEEQKIGGPDFYKWGFKETRAEVDKFLTYCHQDGVTTRKFEPEDMFHVSTLGT